MPYPAVEILNVLLVVIVIRLTSCKAAAIQGNGDVVQVLVA